VRGEGAGKGAVMAERIKATRVAKISTHPVKAADNTNPLKY